MSTIATLVVQLIADTSEFVSGMEKAQGQAKEESASMSQTFSSMGTSLQMSGMMMTNSVTKPIVDFGEQSLTAASNMQVTKDKVKSLFGDMSDQVIQWSQTSASSFGESSGDALDNMSKMDLWAKQAGLSGKAAVGFDEKNVKMAADMAAFFNTSPDEMMQKLTGAYGGMTRGLKQYGIELDPASIKQEALALGLIKGKEPLTEQAKILATNALIMKQASETAGAFSNNAGSLAIQQKIVNAEFEDAKEKLGEQLMPYAVKFMGYLGQLITWFTQLTPTQQKWIIGLAAAAAAIGPLLMVLGMLATGIGAIAGVIGLISVPVLIVIGVIAALIAIGALLYAAWQTDWGGIREKTSTVMLFIQNLISDAMDFITNLTTGKMGILSTIWEGAWTNIQTFIQGILNMLSWTIKAWQDLTKGNFYAFGDDLRQICDTAWNTIVDIFRNTGTTLWNVTKQIIAGVINFFKSTDWGAVGMGIINGIISGLESGASALYAEIKRIVNATVQVAQGFLKIHSPSGLMRDVIGVPMAQGVIAGWAGTLTPTALQPALASAISMPSVSVPAVSGGGASGSASNNDLMLQLQDMLSEFNSRLRTLPDDMARANNTIMVKMKERA